MLRHCHVPCPYLHGSACSCPPRGPPSHSQAPEAFSILAYQLLGLPGKDLSWKVEIPMPPPPLPLQGPCGVRSSPLPTLPSPHTSLRSTEPQVPTPSKGVNRQSKHGSVPPSQASCRDF